MAKIDLMADRRFPTEPFDPFPSPTLTPSEVVRLYLDALQNNDLTPADDGIRAAYRFHSWEYLKTVGGHEAFLRVIKDSPLYRPLIGFERAELGTLAYSVFGDQVRQRIWLHRRGRSTAIYRYVLSKQTDEPLVGCWMIDAIIREV
jgi:hypothetical protein